MLVGLTVSSRRVVSEREVNAEMAEDAVRGDIGTCRGRSIVTGVFVPVAGRSRMLNRMGSLTPE